MQAVRLVELEKVLRKQETTGASGLGHTRWATHGAPSELNAHPHTDQKKKIVVVHNGIIENYATLKRGLMEKGVKFESETDTEVVAQLIAYHWESPPAQKNGHSKEAFVEAVQKALAETR